MIHVEYRDGKSKDFDHGNSFVIEEIFTYLYAECPEDDHKNRTIYSPVAAVRTDFLQSIERCR